MDLVSKYNIAAPRYTSYPTVPYWDCNLDESTWRKNIADSFAVNNKDGISLYIHLPFCESLCTYCACNTRITVNHKVEEVYISSLIKEWQLYLSLFNEKPNIKEIHLGGGTPTFFSANNLKLLIETILNTCDVAFVHDFSFEGHPGNTTREHLQALFDLGFRRVSFGIQDFDDKVQDAINRYQSFMEVKEIFELARKIGYTSINADLVYGLPHQDVHSVEDTVEKLISLKPERIAFYSYAHVPWLKPGQRKYSEKDLPLDKEKRNLYNLGSERFIKAGYSDIGMDHFALPGDELFDAFHNGSLHRNFMGYTTNTTKLLVGLGCSSISDSYTAYSQNIKIVEEYEEAVNHGSFPLLKGHVLSKEDRIIRDHILNLMCRHVTEIKEKEKIVIKWEGIEERLKEFASDRLLIISGNKIIVTEIGKQFLRNICLSFDNRFWARIPQKSIFSTTS
ncbi:MAG: oxygen-independent coproporphyrinogen III oxidase [Bacteroidia bacterium]